MKIYVKNLVITDRYTKEHQLLKRAVQAALDALEKALKPNSSDVIKNHVKRKFWALQEHFQNYENTYFGSELVDEELTSTNDIFYEIGAEWMTFWSCLIFTLWKLNLPLHEHHALGVSVF